MKIKLRDKTSGSAGIYFVKDFYMFESRLSVLVIVATICYEKLI